LDFVFVCSSGGNFQPALLSLLQPRCQPVFTAQESDNRRVKSGEYERKIFQPSREGDFAADEFPPLRRIEK
jgi:hypothetical protein